MRTITLFLLLAVACCAENVFTGQAGTSAPANTWTHIANPTGYWPSEQSYDKYFYVPSLDGVCGFTKGYRSIGTEPNRSLSCYIVNQNRWFNVNDLSTYHDDFMPEAAHPMGAFVYDPISQLIYGHGMYSGAQGSDIYRGTWLYDITAQAGRWRMAGVGTPSSPTGAKPPYNMVYPSGVFDQKNRVELIWDGDGYDGVILYDPVANTYSINPTSTGSGPGAGQWGFGTAYNAHDGKVYFFGGAIGYTNQNTMYRYDVTTRVWETLSPSGTPPSARRFAALAYSTADNIFVMFGGTDGNVSLPTDHTWIFDPAANGGQGSWSQVNISGPTGVNTTSFERLVYDEKSDLFVFVNQAANNMADIWVYRYKQGAPIGSVSITYTPEALGTCATGGTCNRALDTWAQGAALANNADTLFEAHAEVGAPNDMSDCTYFKPYSQLITTTGYSNLGAGCQTMAGGIQGTESADLEIAYVGSVPWATFHTQNNSSFGLDTVVARGYSSGSWPFGGLVGNNVPNGTGTTWLAGSTYNKYDNVSYGGTNYASMIDGNTGITPVTGANWVPTTEGHSAIADVNGVPHVILQKQLRGSLLEYVAIVRKWDGAKFVQVGSEVNFTRDAVKSSVADAVAITSDGTNPVVAWTEHTTVTAGNPQRQLDSAPQVYIKQWNRSAWTQPCATSGNVSTSDSANGISVAYYGGSIYVAFNERTLNGNTKLYVRKCASGSWSTVGGAALNRDATDGWTWRPRMKVDSTGKLYVAWTEQGNQQPWIASGSLGGGAYAQRPQVYVAKWDGSSWAYLGGSANVNSTDGSASRASLALINGTTVAAGWGEVLPGYLRQTYIRTWDGANWIPFGLITAATAPGILTMSLVNGEVGKPYSQTIATSGAPAPSCSITSGSAPTGLSFTGCTLSGTPTVAGLYTITVVASNGTAPDAIQSYALNSVGTGPSRVVFGSMTGGVK